MILPLFGVALPAQAGRVDDVSACTGGRILEFESSDEERHPDGPPLCGSLALRQGSSSRSSSARPSTPHSTHRSAPTSRTRGSGARDRRRRRGLVGSRSERERHTGGSCSGYC